MNKNLYISECLICGGKNNVLYSSLEMDASIGYYCISCDELYIFDDYEKPIEYEQDLKNIRKQYKKNQ